MVHTRVTQTSAMLEQFPQNLRQATAPHLRSNGVSTESKWAPIPHSVGVSPVVGKRLSRQYLPSVPWRPQCLAGPSPSTECVRLLHHHPWLACCWDCSGL